MMKGVKTIQVIKKVWCYLFTLLKQCQSTMIYHSCRCPLFYIIKTFLFHFSIKSGFLSKLLKAVSSVFSLFLLCDCVCGHPGSLLFSFHRSLHRAAKHPCFPHLSSQLGCFLKDIQLFFLNLFWSIFPLFMPNSLPYIFLCLFFPQVLCCWHHSVLLSACQLFVQLITDIWQNILFIISAHFGLHWITWD